MTDNIKEIEKWRGFKEIKVLKIVKENEFVTSFYLENEDKSMLPSFTAGQFIAVKMKNEDGSFTVPRQYTLSLNSNNEFYRISVKREEEGIISKRLCDELKENDTLYITAPIGNFILKDNEKPLVLIGGGIGITPMLTMAYEAVKTNRHIKLIYSIPNSKHHSFKDEIEKLEKNNKNLDVTTIYTRPLEYDKLGDTFKLSGRISKEYMEAHMPKDGEFYFCGPVQFMKTLYHNLIDMKINKEDINYELFSAGEDITK